MGGGGGGGRTWEVQLQPAAPQNQNQRESQSRSTMLHQQNQHLDSRTSSSIQNKDSNFNFLPGEQDRSSMGRRGGDENRNQVRPRNLTLNRDPSGSSAPGFHLGSGVLSPRGRLPCWSPLEPLPEIESGDDGFGRVPPDGAEEQRMDEEEEEEKGVDEDLDDEWGDSGSDSEFGCQSRGSTSSLEAPLVGGWDRVGVGEPKPSQEEGGPTRCRTKGDTAARPRTSIHKPPTQADPEQHSHDDQSSDSDGEPDAVWTLRDRERFKAEEMEKHQAQLTMYRRLALIRWVRALQGRVQEQQSRLQSSFDVILTHRKELLRMGAAAATLSQS